MIGTVLSESAIPLITEKHAEMFFDRGAPIELEAALCNFVRDWWTHPRRVAVMFTLAHDRRNRQIIEADRLRALAAEEKPGRPLRTADPAGTRRARGKRKRKHGR